MARFNTQNGYEADCDVIYGDTDSVMVDFRVLSLIQKPGFWCLLSDLASSLAQPCAAVIPCTNYRCLVLTLSMVVNEWCDPMPGPTCRRSPRSSSA